MAQLKEIAPENRTGFMPKKINRFVQVIKKKDFIVDHDFSVGGDAPKILSGFMSMDLLKGMIPLLG